MKINEVKYDEDNTDTLSNLFVSRPDLGSWDNLMSFQLAVVKAKGRSTTIRYFQKVFGKQQAVKRYSRPNWVWTFSDDRATLHCLVSAGGVAWEYNKLTSDPEGVLPLAKEVVAKLAEK